MRRKVLRSLVIESLQSRQLFATDLNSTDDALVSTQIGALFFQPLVAEGEPDHGHISEHDPFLPDFSSAEQTSGRQVFRSTSNGIWRDLFSNAREGDVVIIEHDVLFDSNARVFTVVVHEGGRLRFATEGTQRLELVNLQVLHEGILEIGTAAEPHRGNVEIIIRDVPFDLAKDPGQYGNGVIVLGTVSMRGRSIENTYVNTSGDLRGGSQSLAVSNSSDWRPGDKILIPDSRLLFYTAPTVAGLTHYETAIVQSASTNSLLLTTPIKFDHIGARDTNESLVFKPYIANLSRNIVIRSENPNGVRGHTMFIEHATVDVRYVEFRDLGRTLNATPLDNTVFNQHGVATKIGKNQVGRYALHIHHLVGPPGLSADTPQFRITGNSVNNTTENDFRWGLALHNAHYGLVDKNVVYNFAGAGIVTEDGTESFNQFSQNFVSRIPGTKNRGKFSDGTEGSGFWFKRPNNYVNDNVVTGADKAAYAVYGGDNTAVPAVRIPAFKGANPHEDGEFRLLAPKLMHMLSFDNNEAYASHMGLEIWYLGFKTYYDPADEPVQQSLVSGFKAWSINFAGVFGEQANNTRFENLQLYNPKGSHDVNNRPIGFVMVRTKDVSVVNSTIENFYYGAYLPNRVDRLGRDIPLASIRPFVISDSKLRNFVSITIGMPVEDAAGNVPPRYLLIDNIDFDDDPSNVATNKTNIQMRYSDGRFTNIVQKTLVEVTSYNRDPRSNFQLFFNEQAPDFVVPVSGQNGPGSPTGAPVAGLTNQQLWSQYGVAVAGQVAPGGINSGSRLTYPSVHGLAFPLTRSNTGIAILAISPDTGAVGDRRTASQQLTVSGVANPGTQLRIFDRDQNLGTAIANQAGLWSLTLGTLVPGEHVLVASQVGTSNESDAYAFNILVDRPVLTARPVSIPEDLPAGALVSAITATDADTNDTLRFEIFSGNEQGLFRINPADGRVTLTRASALNATLQPNYRIGIRVTDSVALSHESVLEITVTKRPPGFWITQLNYTQFPGLSPEETRFLTMEQIATIPDLWWFRQIPAANRAVLSPQQLAGLNTAIPQVLSFLTRDQQLTLPAHRFGLVPFTEFGTVIPERVSDLSIGQFRAIPSNFWLARIPETVRSMFTTDQIQALNVSLAGMLIHLTNEQRILLTDNQIASMSYGDLRYVPGERASAITVQQLSVIPDSFWLGQIPLSTRAKLNSTQVNAINFTRGGMLVLLPQTQVLLLNVASIRTLNFSDFRFLPPEQIVKLSREQLLTVRDNFWYFAISLASRRALSSIGANWVNGVGFVFS